MYLIATLLVRLKQPYPQLFSVKESLTKAVIAGGVASFIDLFFQPFGLQAYQHPYKTAVLLGFGVPVFLSVGLVGVLFPYLMPGFRLTQERQWTVWKHILASLLITVCIAVELYFYAQWVAFEPFTDIGYLTLCCLSFGILLSAFFLFFDRSALLTVSGRKAINEAEELKMLFRENHHRMRNHIHVIAGILRLQTNSVTDAKALDALRTSEKRLDSIAILHEKLYQNESATTIDLGTYLEDLTRIIACHHADLTPNVTIRVEDRAPLSVSFDTAVPLGLIVNELITNSFKHAFQNVDQCCLDLILDRSADDRPKLTIRDNGPGLPNGLTRSSGTSLGMRLIEALTQQLNAQLSYRQNNGAEFVIQF